MGHHHWTDGDSIYAVMTLCRKFTYPRLDDDDGDGAEFILPQIFAYDYCQNATSAKNQPNIEK